MDKNFLTLLILRILELRWLFRTRHKTLQNSGSIWAIWSHYLLIPRSLYVATAVILKQEFRQGSVLAIDRAITPQHRHIIVTEIEGELVLRRLLINPVPALQELRGDETITLLDESQELPVWGVVAYALTDVAGLGFNHPPDE